MLVKNKKNFIRDLLYIVALMSIVFIANLLLRGNGKNKDLLLFKNPFSMPSASADVPAGGGSMCDTGEAAEAAEAAEAGCEAADGM